MVIAHVVVLRRGPRALRFCGRRSAQTTFVLLAANQLLAHLCATRVEQYGYSIKVHIFCKKSSFPMEYWWLFHKNALFLQKKFLKSGSQCGTIWQQTSYFAPQKINKKQGQRNSKQTRWPFYLVPLVDSCFRIFPDKFPLGATGVFLIVNHEFYIVITISLMVYTGFITVGAFGWRTHRSNEFMQATIPNLGRDVIPKEN